MMETFQSPLLIRGKSFNEEGDKGKNAPVLSTDRIVLVPAIHERCNTAKQECIFYETQQPGTQQQQLTKLYFNPQLDVFKPPTVGFITIVLTPNQDAIKRDEQTENINTTVVNSPNSDKTFWKIEATLRPTPKLAKTRKNMNETAKQRSFSYGLGLLESSRPRSTQWQASTLSSRPSTGFKGSLGYFGSRSGTPASDEVVIRDARKQMTRIMSQTNTKLSSPRFTSPRSTVSTPAQPLYGEHFKSLCKQMYTKHQPNNIPDDLDSLKNVENTSLQMYTPESKLQESHRKSPKGKLYKSNMYLCRKSIAECNGGHEKGPNLQNRKQFKDKTVSLETIGHGTQKVTWPSVTDIRKMKCHKLPETKDECSNNEMPLKPQQLEHQQQLKEPNEDEKDKLDIPKPDVSNKREIIVNIPKIDLTNDSSDSDEESVDNEEINKDSVDNEDVTNHEINIDSANTNRSTNTAPIVVPSHTSGDCPYCQTHFESQQGCNTHKSNIKGRRFNIKLSKINSSGNSTDTSNNNKLDEKNNQNMSHENNVHSAVNNTLYEDGISHSYEGNYSEEPYLFHNGYNSQRTPRNTKILQARENIDTQSFQRDSKLFYRLSYMKVSS